MSFFFFFFLRLKENYCEIDDSYFPDSIYIDFEILWCVYVGRRENIVSYSLHNTEAS
jgi:hypothetical protein